MALAFPYPRPGQRSGPAWPGFFWPGLAWLLAWGQSRHITTSHPTTTRSPGGYQILDPHVLGKNSLNPCSLTRRIVISLTWFESLSVTERVNQIWSSLGPQRCSMFPWSLFFVLILRWLSSFCVCMGIAKFPKSLCLSLTKWRQLAYPIVLITKFFNNFLGESAFSLSLEDIFFVGSPSSDGCVEKWGEDARTKGQKAYIRGGTGWRSVQKKKKVGAPKKPPTQLQIQIGSGTHRVGRTPGNVNRLVQQPFFASALPSTPLFFPITLNIPTQENGSVKPSNFSSVPQNHASIRKGDPRTRKPYESISGETI